MGNFKEALVETNDWLRLIEGNTRRGGVGGNSLSPAMITEAVQEGLRSYFATALQVMPS